MLAGRRPATQRRAARAPGHAQVQHRVQAVGQRVARADQMPLRRTGRRCRALFLGRQPGGELRAVCRTGAEQSHLQAGAGLVATGRRGAAPGGPLRGQRMQHRVGQRAVGLAGLLAQCSLLHRLQGLHQAPLVGIGQVAAVLPAGQQLAGQRQRAVVGVALGRGQRQQALAVHHRRQLRRHVRACTLQHQPRQAGAEALDIGLGQRQALVGGSLQLLQRGQRAQALRVQPGHQRLHQRRLLGQRRAAQHQRIGRVQPGPIRRAQAQALGLIDDDQPGRPMPQVSGIAGQCIGRQDAHRRRLRPQRLALVQATADRLHRRLAGGRRRKTLPGAQPGGHIVCRTDQGHPLHAHMALQQRGGGQGGDALAQAALVGQQGPAGHRREQRALGLEGRQRRAQHIHQRRAGRPGRVGRLQQGQAAARIAVGGQVRPDGRVHVQPVPGLLRQAQQQRQRSVLAGGQVLLRIHQRGGGRAQGRRAGPARLPGDALRAAGQPAQRAVVGRVGRGGRVRGCGSRLGGGLGFGRRCARGCSGRCGGRCGHLSRARSDSHRQRDGLGQQGQHLLGQRRRVIDGRGRQRRCPAALACWLGSLRGGLGGGRAGLAAGGRGGRHRGVGVGGAWPGRPGAQSEGVRWACCGRPGRGMRAAALPTPRGPGRP